MRTIRWQGAKEMAGGEGFEPPLAESESAVLPLDEPPAGRLNFQRRGSVPRRPRECILRHQSPQKRPRVGPLQHWFGVRQDTLCGLHLQTPLPPPGQPRHAEQDHAAGGGFGNGVVVAAIANDHLHGF